MTNLYMILSTVWHSKLGLLTEGLLTEGLLTEGLLTEGLFTVAL